jgi:hypothetical protein
MTPRCQAVTAAPAGRCQIGRVNGDDRFDEQRGAGR